MKTICLPEKKLSSELSLNPILPLPLPARLPHTPRRCSPISNIKLLPAFIYLSRKLSTESHTSSKPICLFRTPSPTSFHQPSVPFLTNPKQLRKTRNISHRRSQQQPIHHASHSSYNSWTNRTFLEQQTLDLYLLDNPITIADPKCARTRPRFIRALQRQKSKPVLSPYPP